MAVPENTSSRPRAGTPRRTAAPALGALLLAGSLLGPTPAGAQIVADPSAPSSQRPTILAAPNGVPLVNIQTPSAAGVSRNTYSQFDVPTAGAILNNARSTATTRLGGLVQSNPWLATGSARVILNEVNAANPSQLLGYLEVGGARAEVIVANPAGIRCSGCGFINASRATLTTGTPLVTDGRLDGYRVGTGTLVIDDLGLDARDTDFTQLIARAIRVNAGVWAQDLRITTGATTVASDGSGATPFNAPGPAPTIALDVAALGGMYAGKIHLIGTEAGVGFRNAGQIGASAGEVRIDQRGWIDNSGQIDSTTQLTVTTPSTLASNGVLHAGGNIVLYGDAGLSVDGSAVAGGDLSLTASNPGARLASGSAAWLIAGHGTDGGTLSLAAVGPLAAHGTLLAGTAIDARAASLDLGGAQLVAPAVQLHATQGDLDLSASRLYADHRLSAATPGVLRSAAANISAGQLTLSSHDLDNTGGILVQLGTDPLQLLFAGTLDNSGGRLAANAAAIELGAATLVNRGGQIEHRGSGTLTIHANTFAGSDGQLLTQGPLDLSAGRLELDRAQTQAEHLTLSTAEFSHRQGTLLQTGSAPATLTIGGRLDNQDGRIATNADLTLTAAALDNTGGRLEALHGSLALAAGSVDNTRGQLYATDDLRLAANTVTNRDGSAYAERDVSFALTGGFNHSGVLAAGRHLDVSATWIDASATSLFAAGLQADGRLTGDGALTLSATASLAAHGQNLAAGALALTAGNGLDLAANTTTARNLTLRAAQLDAHGARLVAAEQLQAQISGHLDSRDAEFSADHLILDAASLDNRGGVLINTGTATVRLQLPGALDNRGGQIASNADLALNVAAFDNRGGSLVATQSAQLTASVAGLLDNTAGLIAGNHGLTLGAAHLANLGGQIEVATGTAQLNAGILDNAGGRIDAATDLSVQGGALFNGNGNLYAGRDASVALSGLLQHDGTIAAGRHLAVSAARIDAGAASLFAAGLQTDGRLAGAGALSLQSTAALAAHGQALAAASLSLSAPDIDLTGSQVGAQAIRLGADTLTLSGANLRADTTLEARANGLLDTRAAHLSATLLGLQAQRLDNTGGDLRQTGSGELALVLPGTLLNTGGQILSNGDTLSLRAASVDNRGGLIGHAGSGRLTIDTPTFSGSGGQLISNGRLDLSAQHLQLDDATTQADTWHIHADTLDHQRGNLLQTGSGTSTLDVAPLLDNRAGRIAGNGSLTLSAGTFDNAGGTVLTAVDLSLRAARLDNPDGTLYAARDLNLALAGTLNHGGLLGAGRDLGVSAAAISAGSSSLIAAGLQADGRLAGSGSLTLSAESQLDAHGRQLAAGSLVLDAGTLDLSASQSAAGSIRLTARNGDLRARGAEITASSLLQTHTAGLLDIQRAHLGAASVALTAAALDNTDGEILQTGNAELALDLPGALTNTGGRIASNGSAVRLTAASIDNTAGHIEHAGSGTLTLRTPTFSGSGGQIASAGTLDLVASRVDLDGATTQATSLVLSADSLSHQGGSLWQTSSGGTRLTVAGLLDNRGGQITGNGPLTLAAGTVDNRHGEIASTRALSLTAATLLDNRDSGRLYAGSDATLEAAQLANRGGEITASGRLNLAAATVGNTAGLIAAGTDLQLAGRDVDNHAGTLAAVAGKLTLTTGQLDNTAGTLIASSLTLHSDGPLTNRDGRIVASGERDAGTLDIHSGPLDNQGGLIQAPGRLSIDTHGADLINRTTLSAGGILGGAEVVLHSGRFDNQAGYLGAGRLELVAGDVDNTAGGTLASLGATTLTATALHNTAGRLYSAGDLSLGVATTLDNTHGAIQSAQHAELNAAALLNVATQAPGLGIQGRSLSLATSQLDNRDGLLAADDSLHIQSSGRIDNTRGVITALGYLVLGDPNPLPTLAITNTGGQLLAGQQLSITAATLSGDGRLLSSGGLDLRLTGDFTNDGELRANGNARVSLPGTFTNRASLAAGGRLEVAVATLDNRAGGDIQAGEASLAGTTTVVNRGLIDAGETRLVSPVVDNLGSGRLYGDHLAIQAATLTNATEDGSAPVIAARVRLDLGVGQLVNNEHALVFSAGELAIGGALDAAGHASGQARSVTNRSATLEALGNLTLAAERIDNLNAHFSTEVVRTSVTTRQEFSFKDQPERYDATETHYTYSFDDDGVHTLVLNAPYTDGRQTAGEQFNEYRFTRTVDELRLLTSDPARIQAGGNLQMAGSALTNDMSQIIAGGQLQLDLTTLDNRSATGTRTITDSGTATNYWRRHRSGTDSQGTLATDYAPAPTIQTYTLATSIRAEHTTVAGSGTAVGERADLAAPLAASGAQATAPASRGPVLIEVSSSIATGTPVTGQAIGGASTATVLRDSGVVPDGTAVDATALAQTGATDGPTPHPPAPGTPTVRSAASGADSGTPPALAIAAGSAIPAGMPTVVRAVVPSFTLPTSSLFRVHPESSAHYLIETDPRFTDSRLWLGSDYLLGLLASDPNAVQKRLGDGFYEQRLVREQVAQLTGRRFLDGYADDETQYAALMSAGARYAQARNLRPGVALSAEQMAQLTTDIVWLVDTPVTLANGSVTHVLAPQVYARVREGDIDGAGGLLSGASLSVAAWGEVSNIGTLAARERLDLAADTLRNVGGRIAANVVVAQALGDLTNLGGRIEAGQALALTAGRDLTLASTTSTTSTAQGSRTAIDQLATVYVAGGKLTLTAGRDLRLDASQLLNLAPTGAGPAGSTTLAAGRNLDLGTVTESHRQDIVWDARNARREGQDSEVGTTVHTTGELRLLAGQDLTARAAQLTSDQGVLTATAGRDLTLLAGTERVLLDEAHQIKERSLLSSKTTTTRSTLDATTALATTLSGNTTTLNAGQDIRVTGSNVVSSEGTTLAARRDIGIEAAATARSQSSQSQTTKSGLLGGSGLGFTVGTQQRKDTAADAQVVQVGSTVGAVDGSVLINAGRDLSVKASDVLAGKDVTLIGRNVTLDAAQDTADHRETHEFKQSGVTLALKSAITDTAQAAYGSAQRAQEAQDGRLGTLYAVKAAATVASSYDAMKQEAAALSEGNTGSVSIQVSVGNSRSHSGTEATAAYAHGSQILAGGNLNIAATGEHNANGQLVDGTGTLSALASTLKGQNVSLDAAGDLLLQGGQNRTAQQSSNNSSGWSAGVGLSLGKQTGITFSGSAHKGTGGSDGRSVQQVATRIDAGDTLALRSGRDTVLDGAQATATRVVAEVGRDLLIRSEQDTLQYHADQHQVSAGASVTYGSGGGSANVAFNWSQAHADYASVTNQSGLFAGAGGYDVTVGRHTQLDGGAIASTAPQGLNRFSTASLGYTDLANHKEAAASAGGVNLSSDLVSNPLYGLGKSLFGAALANASQARSDNSTTYAVITAGTLDIRGGNTQASDTLRRDLTGATRALAQDDIGALQTSVNRRSEAGTVVADIVAVLADDGIRKFLNPTLNKTLCIQQPCTNDQVENTQRLAQNMQQIATAHPEWSDEQVRTRAIADMAAYDPNRSLDAVAVQRVARGEQRLDSDLSAQDRRENLNNIQTLPASITDLATLSNEEKTNTTVFSNGIFNSLDRAAQLAMQMTPTNRDTEKVQSSGETTLNTTYLVHTDQASNLIGEFIVAGIEKAAEILNIPPPAARLKASAELELSLVRDAAGQAQSRPDGTLAYDNPVNDAGHSRGTMTQSGTLSLLAQWGVTQAPLSVIANNPAAEQERLKTAANAVSRLGSSFWAPPNDPVASLIGGYPGSLSKSDVAQMFSTPYSVHSCGGAAALGCDMANVNLATLFSYQGLDINEMNQHRQTRTVQFLNAWLVNPPSAPVPAMDLNALQINQNEQQWPSSAGSASPVSAPTLPVPQGQRAPLPSNSDARLNQLEVLRQQLGSETQ